jgi:hypothetical protein
MRLRRRAPAFRGDSGGNGSCGTLQVIATELSSFEAALT